MQPADPPAWLPIAILVAFPIVFVGIWSFVCLIISLLSGWGAMSVNYRCPEGLVGEPLPSGFGNMVGVASYRGVLRFERIREGLIARVSRLFPSHPPLFFPWGAIQLSAGGGFFAGQMQVRDGATFRLNRDAFDAIARSVPQAPAQPWGRPV